MLIVVRAHAGIDDDVGADKTAVGADAVGADAAGVDADAIDGADTGTVAVAGTLAGTVGETIIAAKNYQRKGR